jgi:hypothetical protein
MEKDYNLNALQLFLTAMLFANQTNAISKKFQFANSIK